MIRIAKPYLICKDDKTRIYCDIFVEKKKKNIWFEVDKKYEKYLCVERADAYVIGLIHFAMLENHDIYSDIPVTEELLYNINVILVPILTKYSDKLNKIKVVAETAPALKEGEAVGTGCSCGVDSFSAIYSHMNTKYKGLDLTHLCINNVGAFNECYASYGIEKTKNERYEITDKVAKELNLELIKTDSNFADVVKQNHLETSTYSCVFAIYMLQKLWKVYYLASSGEDYSHFTVVDFYNMDCTFYDLLSLQCFSHEGIKIYCEGGERERFDKTKELVDFEIAQKYLHVCTIKPYNCGKCPKCRRTLVALDALNKLQNFEDVFDLDYYRKNKKDYYKWLVKEHFKKDIMNEPSYQILNKRKDFRRMVIFTKIIETFKIPFYKFKIYLKNNEYSNKQVKYLLDLYRGIRNDKIKK